VGGRGGARDSETIQVRLFLSGAVASLLGVIVVYGFSYALVIAWGDAEARRTLKL